MQIIVKEWITNITVIAILAALVDIILPNGNFRKFTGFIFGLVLLIMILQPILQLIGQTQDIETLINNNIFNYNMKSISHQAEYLEGIHKTQLENEFQRNLEANLVHSLGKAMNLKNITVKFTFGKNGNETDLSVIKRIEVYAEEKEQPVFIEPIDVSVQKENPRKLQSIDDTRLIEIRSYISQLYEINQNDIYINGK